MFYICMNNNITFKSSIRLVPQGEFNNIIQKIGRHNSVNYPWTMKESILSESAYTTRIFDCTACGFTDGEKVLLNHICPTNPENRDFKSITDFIKKKINLANNNLQGFILGSKTDTPESPNSSILFDKFIKFMEEHGIPFSMFKGSKYENNAAYLTSKDEWIISNPAITDSERTTHLSPKEITSKFFDEITISELDELSW